MPNWVNNTIQCKKEILLKYVNDQGYLDFNKIIPMPESLALDECEPLQSQSVACYITKKFTIKLDDLNPYQKRYCKELIESVQNGTCKEDLDEMYRLGKRYIDNMRMYGAATWYHWCIDNWGTKWNACDTDPITEDSTSFDTAWSAPEPIFEKICELNPQEKITFISDYFDGDDLEVVYRNNNGMLEVVSEEHTGAFEEDED